MQENNPVVCNVYVPPSEQEEEAIVKVAGPPLDKFNKEESDD